VSVKTAHDGKPPVLVIGAGPAGIVTAYFLQKHNIPYQVIDQADGLASTWASLYPSLRLNTSRYFSHLPGKKFPRPWGTFPTGKQYHHYLTEFVAEHRLNIRLGVKVTCVMPENGGYRVESSDGSAWYPVVVLATGRFSNPYTAQIPGLDQFEGIRLHAHDYRDAAHLANRRVMVVGSGPSGVDIAIEVGQRNAPEKPALLAMRTGITLRRRYPLGISKHGWMLLVGYLPKTWAGSLLDWTERISEYPPALLHGIKAPPPGQLSGAVAVRGPELIHAVQRGQVICTDAPAQIRAHSVTLTDGSTHDIDALVIATGYRPALGFLQGIVLTPDEQGWPTRFNSRVYAIDYAKSTHRGTYDVGDAIDAKFQPTLRELAGQPGLFQVGLYYKGKGAMYNFNIEAEITAAQIKILMR